MLDNTIIYVIIYILVVVSFGSGLGILIKWTQIHFFDAVPCEVYVDNELVYRGISAGININTGGANTTVAVYGGFLYLFLQKYYVSSNVKVEGIK